MNDLDAVAAQVRGDLERFGEVAERFCVEIEQWEADPLAMLPRDRLILLEPLLAEVYMEASRLPLTGIWYRDEDDDEDAVPAQAEPSLVPVERWHEIDRTLQRELGALNWYPDLFDPYWAIRDRTPEPSPMLEAGEPLTHSLSDHLGSVFVWLKQGLMPGLETGEAAFEAAWEWRFEFENHAGQHAVNALCALYFLLHFGLGDNSEFGLVRWTTVRTNV